MAYDMNAHAMVYQVLDDVLSARAVTPGVRGAMFSLIDELRTGPADTGDVRRAEDVSIAIHRLEWALQRGDRDSSEKSLDELRRLAVDWLNTRIRTRH